MTNQLSYRILVFSLFLVFLSGCNSAEKNLEQGRALMREGKFREAVQALNKAVEADPENYEALNTRGVAYFELKDYTNAQLDYDQALKVNPKFYRPYYNRGLLKVAKGDAAGAIRDYSEAARLVPDTSRAAGSEILVNRGQLFGLQQQTDAAMIDFNKAVELNPRNAVALYNRGNLLFQQRRLQAATADFKKAVEVDPKFAKAFYGLGVAQVLMNEQESGCLSLKQAQQLGYADAAGALAEYCK